MSASRVSRPAGAAIAAMFVALAGTPALSQGTGPFRLMPLESRPPIGGGPAEGQETTRGTAPPAALPAPPAVTRRPGEDAVPADPAGRQLQAKDGIEINRLGELDAETVGVLDARAGGLGIDLWQGARRALVVDLVSRLPSEVRSRAAHDLMRRMLLSNARAPEGAAVEPSLAATRVERLVAIGDLEGALTLARAADARALGEPMARAGLDALLLQGDMAAACQAARNGIDRFAGAYWQKATAFCQASTGERARAMTGVDLLRESGEEDRVFFAVAGKLLGYGSAKIDRLNDPRPLDLAMLRAAELPLPRTVLAGADPAVVRAVATSSNADFAVRLEAAERALDANALAPGVLAQLYMAAGTATEGAAEADTWTPEARAALYRAAASEANRAARAAALGRFWAEARGRGDLRGPLRVGLPLLDDLPPSPEYLPLAADAARALLAAGRNVQAQDWYLLQIEWARTDAAANGAAIRLWPLLKLADTDGKVGDSDDSLVRWWDEAGADASGDARDRALLLFLLLDAVGESVPASIWGRLADGNLTARTGAVPGALVQRGLAAAGTGASRGETVAMALIATEGADALRTDAAALHAAVRALVAAGFAQDARRMAVEAAIMAGL